MEKKQYQVELYYGYEISDCGVYHAFEAADPEAATDGDEIAAGLAEVLDTSVDDETFDYNSMYIQLPDTLVERIKADGVKEYLETHK